MKGRCEVAKKRGIARRTISLPNDLDRQMEKRVGTNWSEVARLAFEEKLAELAPKKELAGMASVIERLRTAAKEETSEVEMAGRKAGREWAETSATPRELRRIDSLFDNSARDFDKFFEEWSGDAFGASERLASNIMGDDGPHRSACEEFWEQAVGDIEDWRAEGFALAFAESAREVWNQVKDQI